jgi:hypothetical protein
LIKHPYWENIVLVGICLSSLKLGYDTFYIGETEETYRSKISSVSDYIFNFAFIIEMTVKMIAVGVCMDINSYLKDEWN